MKKTFALLLALALLMSMLLIFVFPVPASAVTPPLGVPDIPEIPDISDDVHVEIPDEVFKDYLEEHPIVIETTEATTEPPTEVPTEAPTEPPVDEETCIMDWREMVQGWYRWWREFLADGFNHLNAA